MADLIVYTDGACSGNPGPGGWAAVIVRDEQEIRRLSGSSPSTTNNRMELVAAIEGMSAAKQEMEKSDDSDCRCHVVTDSMYVFEGITSWIRGWKRNGWRTSSGSPVKNLDLWQRLDQVCNEIGWSRLTWGWTPGHSGEYWNELADQIARNSVQK